MAQIYRQGLMAAGTEEVAAPPSGWTLAAVREVLGTQPGESVQYDCDGGRILFCRKPSPDLVFPDRRFVANMRASFFVGVLIYGNALVIFPTEKVDWHNRG